MTTASILCHQIEKIRFFWGNPNQKNLFTIGISIGLVPFTNAQTLSPKTLLAMADTACYAAKNAGRNGVYVYQDNDLIAQDQNIQWVFNIILNKIKDFHYITNRFYLCAISTTVAFTMKFY